MKKNPATDWYKTVAYQMFRFRVECTRCFIKKQYRWITYHCSSDSYSLLLTTYDTWPITSSTLG